METEEHRALILNTATFQNTYTNADKLLEAAEQLAQTGECDPEEIYQAAHQLEDRIQDFVRRVEQRKVLLDMSVAFHTHVKEVCVPFLCIVLYVLKKLQKVCSTFLALWLCGALFTQFKDIMT